MNREGCLTNWCRHVAPLAPHLGIYSSSAYVRFRCSGRQPSDSSKPCPPSRKSPRKSPPRSETKTNKRRRKRTRARRRSEADCAHASMKHFALGSTWIYNCIPCPSFTRCRSTSLVQLTMSLANATPPWVHGLVNAHFHLPINAASRSLLARHPNCRFAQANHACRDD